MNNKKKYSLLEEEAKQSKFVLCRPLSPIALRVDDYSYPCFKELENVVENTECKNIAITGIYGSGKSSVIETYLSKEGLKKKPLKISLSTFVDEQANDLKLDDIERYNADIEYRIVQHLLYKSDTKALLYSRFNSYFFKTTKDIVCLSIAILFAIIAFIILYEPNFMRIDSIYYVYEWVFSAKVGFWVNIVADIIATLYLLCFICWIIYKGLLHFYQFRITKVKTKGVEFELIEKSSEFNKRLDEIVKFFYVNKYDLIIFEDLDRLYNPDSLFLKLRELNILLNESETFKKDNFTIKFLYAIRDDVFSKGLRTKCFDYIIPVPPVINYFNSSDYLIQHKPELFQELEDEDIRELGIWIPGYRELNNIINEFKLYKKLIMKEGMSEKKLLAIIIYKNLHPQDYSALHNKSGILYNIFENRMMFTDIFTKNDKIEIEKLNEIINNDKNSIRGVKKMYLDYVEREYYVKKMFIKEEGYTIEEILESEKLFDIFKKDGFTKYYYIDEGNDEAGTLPYNIKFRKIQDIVSDGIWYEETIAKTESDIFINTEKKNKLTRKIGSIENESLSKIFEKSDGEENKKIIRQIYKSILIKNNGETNNGNNRRPNEIDEDIVDILQTMIRGGYIVEDYPIYVSFYHSGSLIESDFNFLNSVRQCISKPFGKHLINPELIVKQLVTNDFTKPCILNFDLLEHLMKNAENAHFLQKFIETARKEPRFIVEFSKNRENPYEFLCSIFNEWNEPINAIRSIKEDDVQLEMLVLYLYISNTEGRLQNEEIDFINDSYPLINQNISRLDIKRLKKFVEKYNIKFHSLSLPQGATQETLLEYVKGSLRYDITYNNLRVILGKDYDVQSFSTICRKQDDVMWNYLIIKNIDKTVLTFPETSTKEDPKTLVQLINLRDVEEEWLNKYIAKQENIFNSIDGIVDSRLNIIFKNDKIEATWQNVLEYIEFVDEIKDEIGDFVKRHIEKLKNMRCESESPMIETLKNTFWAMKIVLI